MATSWSVYRGERVTGYTFHHMDEAFDEGPILIQGEVPVEPGRRPSEMDSEKALSAAGVMPHLLDRIASRDPGLPQRGPGSYFSRNDFLAVWKIAEPSLLTGFELKRRLEAFESLKLRIGGTWHVVTKLRPLPSGSARRPRLFIRTSDGAVLAPVRFRNHPYWVYRFLSLIRAVIDRYQRHALAL
jgi:hypothetical protein